MILLVIAMSCAGSAACFAAGFLYRALTPPRGQHRITSTGRPPAPYWPRRAWDEQAWQARYGRRQVPSLVTAWTMIAAAQWAQEKADQERWPDLERKWELETGQFPKIIEALAGDDTGEVTRIIEASLCPA